MNLPNFLTCFRVVLAALFLFLLFLPGAVFKGMALFVFLSASLTDYYDGRIARKKNVITGFGKLMDPIADKILTISAFLAFAKMAIMPVWMAAAIIARDIFITGFRLFLPEKGNVRAAGPSGKQKTALQFAVIIGVLIFLTLRETVCWDPEWTPNTLRVIYWSMLLIVAMTLSSGVSYVVKNKKVFSS